LRGWASGEEKSPQGNFVELGEAAKVKLKIRDVVTATAMSMIIREWKKSQVLIGIIVDILDNIPQYCFLLISTMSKKCLPKKKVNSTQRSSGSSSASPCRNLERAEPATSPLQKHSLVATNSYHRILSTAYSISQTRR
jgi:hypothetical protein